MASITRRGPGQFRARVRRTGHPTLTRTFSTRAAAEAWARDEEARMDRGEWQDTSEARRTTLDDALDRYAREVTPHKRGSRQELARIKRWRAHPLAQRPLASIRGADLAAWRDARGASPNTLRLELAVLSHLFTVARTEWGMESLANPARNVRLPSMPAGRDARLTREAEAEVLKHCGPVLRAAVIVAVESAMRRGELAGLRWVYVDKAARVARLPRTKNGHARDVPLSPRALEALESLPKRLDGYVFGVPKAAAEHLTHGFLDAARAAGVHGVTFHTLRHEATSRLFERGLGMMEVAAITGHRTLAMLRRYVHLRAEDLAAKLAA